MDINMPLDALNQMRGGTVSVELKGGKILKGILIAFDLNTNLTLSVEGSHQLIQGNTVVSVSANSE